MQRASLWTTPALCFLTVAAVAMQNDVPTPATILQKARKSAEEIQDEHARVYILADIGSAQAKASAIEEALQTANMIQERPGRYSAKAIVLHGIANALAAKGDIKGAVETLVAIPKDTRGTPEAFSEIVMSQAAKGDTNGALKTAAMITHGLLRVHALVHIAAIQSKAEKEAAEATLVEALRIAETMNERSMERGLAFATLAAAQAKAGDIRGALRTADAVENVKDQTLVEMADNAKAHVLGAIAAAQAEAGNVEGALKTVAGIKDQLEIPSTKVSALARIAIAQSNVGNRAGTQGRRIKI